MNDTLEIPVRVSYEVANGAASSGGFGIEALVVFAIILAIGALVFMFQGNKSKVEQMETKGWVHEQLKTAEFRESQNDTNSQMRREIDALRNSAVR